MLVAASKAVEIKVNDTTLMDSPNKITAIERSINEERFATGKGCRCISEQSKKTLHAR